MSYPPPVTPGNGAPAPTAPHHEQQLAAQLAEQTQDQPAQPQFDNAAIDVSDAQRFAQAAAAAAAAVEAHHTLQALQAATGATGPAPSASPVTPQYAAPGSHPYISSSSTAPLPAPSANPSQKATRLRRACDLCSQRKVKCDENTPCWPCRDLNVDCTFSREMKRRGPPNKHAEAAKAAKKPRLEPNLSPGPHNAAETLVSIAGAPGPQQPALDAESIAPLPILQLLVDDFFTYIHPLTPFPHEPTFRQSFHNREDRTSRDFLALLASMIGCLVASFPRTARAHLKAQHGMTLFPKAITLVERCRTLALEARGHQFDYKEEVTVYDAATSYFLGLAAAYTMQWKLCRRFMSQSMTFIREMGYHKPRDLGSSMYGVIYRGPPFDHVQDQLGRRIFWCLFLGIRSMAQLGTPQSDIVLPPPTPSEPYPEFPAEVDDRFILRSQILGQPDGMVSLLTGFNQAIKIYMTMNGLVSVELSYGISSLPFHDQKAMLHDCVQAVKQVMALLPRELTLSGLLMDSNNNEAHGMGSYSLSDPQYDVLNDDQFQYYPPAYPAHQPPNDIRHMMENHPERKRLLQYEIQKANIYVSQLATRSYYVERYLNLRDIHREHMRVQAAQGYGPENGAGGISKSVAAAALHTAAEQPDAIDQSMAAEREEVVQNLITVLCSITQRNLEPNGGSLINKIRQVASTLVNDAPDRKGPLAMKSQALLVRFVDMLTRLEKTGAGSGGAMAGTSVPGNGTMTLQDEEEELRSWADFRAQQMSFAQDGAYLQHL